MYTLIITIQGGVIRIKTKGILKTGLLDDRIIIFSFLCNVVDIDFTFLNEKNIYMVNISGFPDPLVCLCNM